jgi:hypothetical protein
MMRTIRRAVLMTLLLPCWLTAGAVAPAASQAPAAARVAGVVVDQESRAAVARAVVMIAGTDVGIVRVTTADAQGRFSFSPVAAGRYLLSAQRRGYLPGTFGASAPGRPGRVVTVAAGQQVTGVELALVAGAAITGRVLDESGQPVPEARIRVLPRREIGGEIATAGDAGDPAAPITDDRGVYRVYNLPPGEYVVAVQPRRPSTAPVSILTDRGVESALASTAPPRPAAAAVVGAGHESRYYGDVTSLKNARPIVVRAGEERAGIDIRTAVVPFVRIDGVVTGDAPRGVQVTLRPRDRDIAGTLLTAFTTTTGPEGRFLFGGVPPGQYTMTARVLPPPGPPPSGDVPQAPRVAARWATRDVEVSGASLSNVRLDLQPALSLSGRLTVEGYQNLPADLPTIRVGLRPTLATVQVPQVEPVAVDRAGRFTITGILPGRYRLFLQIPANGTTQVPDWFAKSAMHAGRDALDWPIDVEPGRALDDLVVTLTDDTQDIDGDVVDAAGRPVRDCAVVLFAVDKSFRFPQSRRIAARVTSVDGAFVFGLAAGLPPGDYFVAAVPGDRPNEQFDPAYLDAVTGSATRVSLGPGESKTVKLRVK